MPRRSGRVAGSLVKIGGAADADAQVVHRVMDVKESDVGLQIHAKLRAEIEKILGAQRLGRGSVEGFDMSPFETNHVEDQSMPAAGVAATRAQPRFERMTQVAHGERLRGVR